MNTKLTLSLEKEVIEQAKIYAKGTGRSLSEMVESYFKSLSNPKRKSEEEDDPYKDVDPSIRKLIGRIKLPDDFDVKKARDEYYKEKYGI